MQNIIKVFSFSIIIILSSFCLASKANATATWQTVGTAFSTGRADSESLVLDSQNIPYVAYIDITNSGKVTVKKWSGTSWTELGSGGISTANGQVSLSIDSGDTLYVAYSDGGNSLKVTVKKWNGESWVEVGSGGVSTSAAYTFSLTLDSSGVPYVAYSDNLNNCQAIVKKWNGESWVTVGNPDFSNGICVDFFGRNIVFDSQNIPYVSFENDDNGKATVMKFNGESWDAIGGFDFTSSGAYYISLAIDSHDIPYLAYQDNANNGKVTVMKYNGTSWVTVGDAGFSVGGAYNESLALDSSGMPYVAYLDATNSNKVTVMRWDGSSWVVVGSAGFSAGAAYSESLAIDSHNTLYLAFSDNSTDPQYKATVMKYVQPTTTTNPIHHHTTGSSQSRLSQAQIAQIFGLPTDSTSSPQAPSPTPSCTITHTLKLHSIYGDEVKCLQDKLNITSDGKFGLKTKQAVVNFQLAHNLTLDGIVGEKTRAELFK